ncbi:MAG: hypothetical protein QY303_12605 [Vicingaceae bacterium]|nr:hypothetical protein [Flavobacteriales bacterium]WKZ74976.1 MAG: hypothetical protein QY303_12605 [Vicingaceae bacterium]
MNKYLPNNIYVKLSLLILVSFWLDACSTKKNTFTSRAYHNTTAHYNGYFNAREIMRAAEQNIYTNHKEDYSEIIPLFLYGDEAMSKSLYPDMDNVIKKCSKVISRHSMFIKGVEINRWMDDAYMLVGKAYFYKKEYPEAMETFEFIARNFKNTPARIEALLWGVRTREQTNETSKLLLLLDLIENEKKLDPVLKGQLHALYAQHHIKKKDYDKAIERLEAAIPLSKNKKQRIRYTFVLAQLYQQTGNFKNATVQYSNVIRLKPKYEMEFQARINRARAFDLEGGNIAEVKKELQKMLHDKKNKEYRDQIYFALGELAFREKEEALGIEYFNKAAASSLGNKKLLTQIYLKLANYYFEKPKYIPAQAYYDSTLQNMDKEDERYFEISEKNKNLSTLVEQIKIIEKEDSLQKVARLSDKERDKIIKELIQKAKDEEAKKQKEQNSNDIVNDYNQNKQQENNAGGGSVKWYFYNPTTRGFGFSDFKKRWGNRPLEDNWRRSNKGSVGVFDENGNLIVKQDSAKKESDENELFSEEYYLKNLPFNDSSLLASHGRICEALYTLGGIYKESFNDVPRAIETFERLAATYDTSQHIASTYYQLFRLHQANKDNQRAEYYKNLILEKFPYSDYARLVNDPNYLKNTRENQKRVENYYDIVYDLFNKEDYKTVIVRCEKSKEIFGPHHIENKFDFLKTLSIGYTTPVDTFKKALEIFIANYPAAEEKPLAQKILDNINKKIAENKPNDANPDNKKDEDIPAYVFDPNKEHYFVLLIPSDKDLNKAKIELSNFNSAYFGLKKLLLNSMLLNDFYQIITVKIFKNMADAQDYYKAISLNEKELKEIKSNAYEYFIFSSENFSLFYQNKNTDYYRQFFMMNYAGK